MKKGREVARGKTKVLYEHPDQAGLYIVASGDDITAGDGARRSVIPGKGRIAAKTTARVFRLLNLCGLPTHFVSGGEDDDDNEMVVRACRMIPLEVVVRGVVAGSYAKRNPNAPRGSLLLPRVIEFFLKDDKRHDPQITQEEILQQGIATAEEVATMAEIARLTFEMLSHAWRRRNVLMVDMKVEFGRAVDDQRLLLADVIDNDAWRLWPQGREELMLDKQMFRNLVGEATAEDLARVKQAYESVCEQVGAFPVMQPAMVAIVMASERDKAHVDRIEQALQKLGLGYVHRVASPSKTPGYLLQLIQQLDATFARLVYVGVCGRSDALSAMLDAATTNPVIACPPPSEKFGGMEALGSLDAPSGVAAVTILEPENAALAAAKLLALDDTIFFGRVLLTQANYRAQVMNADLMLNPPPPQHPVMA
ncbi:MAG TPA: phosphoribosylaminoimidazolesuccinocarboxamide synthase [Candidatus Dormibacteraeota bacterium]|nr:phosphoribosylaminoimidazolesuccinocarboxamide synthase [Candidatus Dormibacteraeota bacterium]